MQQEANKSAFKMPEEIKAAMTPDFLAHFKSGLDGIFKLEEGGNRAEAYRRLEGTIGWCGVFEVSCEALGLQSALAFRSGLKWLDADAFDSELCAMLV